MPESIVINLDTPVVVDPVPQKEFDAMWITQIMIRTLGPTETEGGTALIEYIPMSSSTFEILNQPATSISTDKLMKAVAEVPEVAQAMGAILLAINPLKTWIAAQNPE